MDANAIVSRGVELWNARDRDGFLALFDDGVVYLDPATGDRFVGREEMAKGWYDQVTDGYPDREVRDAVVFGQGNLVCLQARLVGTHTGAVQGPGGQLPATGRRIDSPFVEVFEVENDRITRVWAYGDRLLMLEQEGIVTLEKLMAAGAA